MLPQSIHVHVNVTLPRDGTTDPEFPEFHVVHGPRPDVHGKRWGDIVQHMISRAVAKKLVAEDNSPTCSPACSPVRSPAPSPGHDTAPSIGTKMAGTYYRVKASRVYHVDKNCQYLNNKDFDELHAELAITKLCLVCGPMRPRPKRR